MNNIFSTGRIFLVRKPIRASYGPDRIFNMITIGAFGDDINSTNEETYVVFTNKRRNMLLIFHYDDFGYELTKRKLYVKSRFNIELAEQMQAESLTRESLRRLVLYGSVQESFESLKHENRELKSRLQFEQTAQSI